MSHDISELETSSSMTRTARNNFSNLCKSISGTIKDQLAEKFGTNS